MFILTAISIANITFGIYDADPRVDYTSVDIREGPDYFGFFTKRHLLIPIDMSYHVTQVHTPLGAWQFVRSFSRNGMDEDLWIEFQGRGEMPRRVTVRRVMPHYYFASQPVDQPYERYYIFPAMYAVTHIHDIPVPWDVSDIADLNVSAEPLHFYGNCNDWFNCHHLIPNFYMFYHPRDQWFDMGKSTERVWSDTISRLNITGMSDVKRKFADYDELRKCN